MPNEALKRRLTGQKDSRSTQGIMSRGANVYNGGTPNATSGGGPGFGRPPGIPQTPPVPGGMQPGMPTPPPMGGMQPPGLTSGGPPAPGAPPDMSSIVQSMIQNAPPQYGPPGMGGVGGNPTPGIPPELLAALGRRLGAGGGMGQGVGNGI